MKIEIEKFNGKFFLQWRKIAKGFLMENGVWPAIEQEAVDEAADIKATLYLSSIIKNEILVKFPSCTSAKALWDAIEAYYADSSPLAVKALKDKLEAIKMADNTDKYIDLKVETIAALQASGSPLSEAEQCMSLMNGLSAVDYQAFIQTVYGRGIQSWKFDDLCNNLRHLPPPVKTVALAATPHRSPGPCPVCTTIHWLSQCPDVICGVCKKKGHIAKNCSNKENRTYIAWSVDSGASFSMTNDRNAFISFEETEGSFVKCAGGELLEVRGVGSVVVKGITIEKVRYVPRLQT